LRTKAENQTFIQFYCKLFIIPISHYGLHT
jgi:hypothetical protein